MAVSFPTLIDREVQYPNRLTLTNTSTGAVATYTATASPGTVTQVGTPVNASLMQGVKSYIDAGADGNTYVIGNNRDAAGQSTDFNTLTTTSNYVLGEYAAPFVNGPMGGYHGANLTTKKVGATSTNRVQEYEDRVYATTYKRSISTPSIFRPWAQVGFTGGRLYANTDLNTVTEPGMYLLNTAADASSCTNLPIDATTYFTLEVKPYMASATYAGIIQTLYTQITQDISTRAIYSRYSSNNGTTWGAWFKLTDGGEKYKLENRIALATGDDLDTYIKTGNYAATSDSIARSLVNAPAGAYFGGIMTVYNTLTQSGTRYIAQEYRDYFGKTWTRTNTAAETAWSQWVEQGYQNSNSAVGTDFNSVVTPGRYLMPSSAENKPPVGTNATILTVESRSNPTVSNIQILHQEAKYLSVKYARQSTNGGSTWSNWVLVSDDLSNYVSKSNYNALLARVEALENA